MDLYYNYIFLNKEQYLNSISIYHTQMQLSNNYFCVKKNITIFNIIYGSKIGFVLMSEIFFENIWNGINKKNSNILFM
jgi:hypothetical protein